MKRRWRLWLVLTLLLLVGGLLLLPQVHWPVYGWLRGEAFHQGMPTSWWAKEIEESYQPIAFGEAIAREPPMSMDMPKRLRVPTEWYQETRTSFLEALLQRVRPRNTAVAVMDVTFGGPLFNGDPAALPLLLALVRSESAKVRRVAIAGLLAQGAKQPAVVPALLEAIGDPDDEVRRDATTALLIVDPEAAARAGVK